jgi:hypothetical protein
MRTGCFTDQVDAFGGVHFEVSKDKGDGHQTALCARCRKCKIVTL